MRSSQKLAAVVVLGLLALSTILVLYMADESNRIEAEEAEQQEVAIERATANYISLCLPCHGPAGEGYTEPGVSGTGRIGAPLGGINTSLNQEGVNAQGTPVSGGVAGRARIIHDTIANGLKNPDGSVRMPAWADANGGPLNDQQIEDLVTMIQHVDWNVVYNDAVEASGGYPTPGPAPAAAATTAPAPTAEGSGPSVTITAKDIFFDPKEVSIPADTDVVFTITNQGNSPHNFSVPDLDVSVDVAAGETKTVTINAPAGTYAYDCDVPGHKEAGMVGTLTVE